MAVKPIDLWTLCETENDLIRVSIRSAFTTGYCALRATQTYTARYDAVQQRIDVELRNRSDARLLAQANGADSVEVGDPNAQSAAHDSTAIDTPNEGEPRSMEGRVANAIEVRIDGIVAGKLDDALIAALPVGKHPRLGAPILSLASHFGVRRLKAVVVGLGDGTTITLSRDEAVGLDRWVAVSHNRRGELRLALMRGREATQKLRGIASLDLVAE